MGGFFHIDNPPDAEFLEQPPIYFPSSENGELPETDATISDFSGLIFLGALGALLLLIEVI